MLTPSSFILKLIRPNSHEFSLNKIVSSNLIGTFYVTIYKYYNIIYAMKFIVITEAFQNLIYFFLYISEGKCVKE